MKNTGRYFIQCSKCGERKFYLSRINPPTPETVGLDNFALLCSKCGSVNEGEVVYEAEVKN